MLIKSSFESYVKGCNEFLYVIYPGTSIVESGFACIENFCWKTAKILLIDLLTGEILICLGLIFICSVPASYLTVIFCL